MPHPDLYTLVSIFGALAVVFVRWRREADWRSFDKTKREVSVLAAQVRELERRLQESEADRERLEVDKLKLQAQCDRQQDRIDALKAQNTEQAAEIKSLHHEVEELKRKLNAGNSTGNK